MVIARRGGEPVAAAAAEDMEKILPGISASKDTDITLPGITSRAKVDGEKTNPV